MEKEPLNELACSLHLWLADGKTGPASESITGKVLDGRCHDAFDQFARRLSFASGYLLLKSMLFVQLTWPY